jgi:DNA-binding MarR family transcriptional regulator
MRENRRNRLEQETPGQTDREACKYPLRMGRLPNLAGFLISRAQQWDAAHLTSALSVLDLRPGQYVALSIINENPGISQSTLSRARGSVRSGLVPLLDSLADRGYVKRVTQASDRRQNALHLTPEGEVALKQADAIVLEHEGCLRDILGPEGYDKLVEILAAFLTPDPLRQRR